MHVGSDGFVFCFLHNAIFLVRDIENLGTVRLPNRFCANDDLRIFRAFGYQERKYLLKMTFVLPLLVGRVYHDRTECGRTEFFDRVEKRVIVSS